MINRAVINTRNYEVVFEDDQLKATNLKTGEEFGRVPEDLSLVGIDDSSLAATCEVPLTSVKYPKQKLGKKAAEFLLNMIQTDSPGNEGLLYRPSLIARASTAAPK